MKDECFIKTDLSSIPVVWWLISVMIPVVMYSKLVVLSEAEASM